MTALKLLILTLVATATAFQPTLRRKGASLTKLYGKIDEKTIKDAATHFGKYSVKEVEEMKNELHKERIQSMVFERSSVSNNDKVVEQRIMEQELDLQLSLLKKDMEEETRHINLFPEVEDSMEELPHLKDGTMAQKVAKQEEFLFVEGELFEENVLETLAFCGVLALLMFAPNII